MHSAEAGCDLIVDDVGPLRRRPAGLGGAAPGEDSPEQGPGGGRRVNQIKGVVWELGYLGNRSTYRIKTETGKLVTVFAQNDRRTSEWSIDWSDEVYLSWTANCAVLLHQ